MWIAYAMAASLFWGVSYTLSEQMMKKISIASVMLTASLGGLLFSLALGLTGKTFGNDIALVKKDESGAKLLLASVAVYVIANIFILLATKAKNATMAGMIEITYPLFTAIFAYVLFKEVQVNAGTLVGAGLIVAGVACIYYFGKNL